MKNFIFFLMAALCLSVAVNAQTKTATTNGAKTETARRPSFRATKEQVAQVQRKLGAAETGKMDDAFREQVKSFQSQNGLRSTGSLNRATLEKMGIELTDKQKEIPVDPKSFKSANSSSGKRGPVFRATKDQITAAQRLLKSKNFYAGEPNGSLDDPTRAALKAYQEANGIKVTGTLNQLTLSKMGIALTDKQKENVAKLENRGI